MRQNFLKRVRRAVVKIGSNVISNGEGLLPSRIAAIS
jgi:glutamate 5-kinase